MRGKHYTALRRLLLDIEDAARAAVIDLESQAYKKKQPPEEHRYNRLSDAAHNALSAIEAWRALFAAAPDEIA